MRRAADATASANKRIISRLNAGMSSGFRLVTRRPSVTTSLSTQVAPALLRSVFSEGQDVGTLVDAACPKEGTWVELALRSNQNKAKLRKLLERSHRAFVVVEGEFYGAPQPDPKLPEPIRKSYHAGWGHLAAFKTKLVVHALRDVKPAPTERIGRTSLNH